MIVGRFVGKEALSAVGGGTGTVINLLVGFFVGLASGATVIISQYYGAKREEMVGYAVHTAMAFSLAGGLVMTVGGLLAAPGILQAMNTPADVLEPATLYIRIYFLGMVGNLVYNVGSGILRAVVLRMGVAGAALATILSQLLSAALVILVLMRTGDMHHLELKEIGFDGRMFKRIIRIGFPAGLQSVQYYHPGGHQRGGHGHCGGMDCLRQGGRGVLDDCQRLWHCHHHVCGPELRRREDRPCKERHPQLPGYDGGIHGGGVRLSVSDLRRHLYPLYQ